MSRRSDVTQQALAEQERDYLAAYLHTRVDANGKLIGEFTKAERRQILRLLASAKRQGISWTVLPMRLTLDARTRRIAGREAPNRGRPRKAPIPIHGSTARPA